MTDRELRARIREALRSGSSVAEVRRSLEQHAGPGERDTPAQDELEPDDPTARALWQRVLSRIQTDFIGDRIGKHEITPKLFATWLRPTWGLRLAAVDDDGWSLSVEVPGAQHRRALEDPLYRGIVAAALALEGEREIEVRFVEARPRR